MRSTESIQGSLNDDWTGTMGLDLLRVLYFAYFLMDLGPVQMASGRVSSYSGDKQSGGGLFSCWESAVRLRIGH